MPKQQDYTAEIIRQLNKKNLAELCEKGLTVIEIADIIGVSRGKIMDTLKFYGLKTIRQKNKGLK